MAAEKKTGGNGGNTKNFSYSSFTGLVIEQGERAAYKAALAAAGITDADVKKGFGTPESIKAREELKKHDITGYNLSGQLGYLAVREKNIGTDAKPNQQKFLVAGLADGNETMYLELSLATDAAGALARKLVNVEPGSLCTIGLFATVNDAGYANHAATVKIDGVEVKGTPFKEGPGVAIEAKLKALKDAGVEDKDILSKTRRNAIGGYNEAIVTAVHQKFEDYRASNKGHTGIEVPAATSASAGFDVDPDIPF